MAAIAVGVGGSLLGGAVAANQASKAAGRAGRAAAAAAAEVAAIDRKSVV